MSATEPIASSREFTLLGITYGIYGLSVILVWPVVIGVLMAYVKRHDVPALLSSHYRWLITTFWWWLIAWVLIIAGMLAVIVPNALEIESAVQSEQYFNIPWELIGAGTLGALAIAFVWLWVVYRLIRGGVRLSDGQAAP